MNIQVVIVLRVDSGLILHVCVREGMCLTWCEVDKERGRVCACAGGGRKCGAPEPLWQREREHTRWL